MENLSIAFQEVEPRHSFLGREEMQTVCPVAFTSAPTHPTCSDRYAVLRTIDIVDMLASYGWLPVQARQTGKGPMPKRSLHMIVFENPGMVMLEKGLATGLPRVILINSLDGFTKLQFFCGIFRFVCSNGLVLASTEFGSLKVKHANTTVEAVDEQIRAVINQMNPFMETISRMASIDPAQDMLMDFMVRALALRIRFKVPEPEKSLSDYLSVAPEMMLPLHESDEGRTDLWYHYNNIQERMSRGKFEYQLEGKERKLRRLVGLSSDLDFNRKLFQLATEFII